MWYTRDPLCVSSSFAIHLNVPLAWVIYVHCIYTVVGGSYRNFCCASAIIVVATGT